MIQLRGQLNRPFRIFRNIQQVVNRVGRARRNRMHIEHAARLPGIALVHLIPIGIKLIRLVEMRSRLNRAFAAVFHLAAPEDHFAGGIGGLKLQPDIERINRAAGEEMPDLARSDNHVHTGRRPRVNFGCA